MKTKKRSNLSNALEAQVKAGDSSRRPTNWCESTRWRRRLINCARSARKPTTAPPSMSVAIPKRSGSLMPTMLGRSNWATPVEHFGVDSSYLHGAPVERNMMIRVAVKDRGVDVGSIYFNRISELWEFGSGGIVDDCYSLESAIAKAMQMFPGAFIAKAGRFRLRLHGRNDSR